MVLVIVGVLFVVRGVSDCGWSCGVCGRPYMVLVIVCGRVVFVVHGVVIVGGRVVFVVHGVGDCGWSCGVCGTCCL